MFNNELLRKAESGDVESALEVANCYYRGIDVEEDNDKAFEWYNRILTMEPDNDIALTSLSSCYQCGFGVEKTVPRLLNITKKQLKAITKLPCGIWKNLYFGDGIEKNVQRAIELYTHAANLGDVDSQVKLGNIYRDGETTE